MGGMFTVVKVREGLARGDYKDPGWYKHPQGTVAHEWTGELPPAPRAPDAPPSKPSEAMDVKRDGDMHHHH
jgi:hypothetical protein